MIFRRGFLKEEIRLKSRDEIERIREAGRIISAVFSDLDSISFDGISTLEIDSIAERKIISLGGRASFKTVVGYSHATCVSVNDEVVHSIPSKKKILRVGDIVKVDVGAVKNGYFADACRTYMVGDVTDDAFRLVAVTREALKRGVASVKVGATLGDIGHSIQSFAEGSGYSVVRDYSGHGVGFSTHEQPIVLHYGRAGSGLRIPSGLVIAVEPMLNAGGYKVKTLDDGWTVVTCDGSLSAQFEDTIAITESGVEILTE